MYKFSILCTTGLHSFTTSFNWQWDGPILICISSRGGVWGYAEFVAAIQDPGHPGHEQMLEWVGGQFDPNEFDLDEVNHQLTVIK